MPAGQRSLDRLLWAGQWMLALSFHLIGMIKLGLMVHDLQPHFGLRVDATTGMLHALGLVEAVLSLAVIFPALLHVVPKLSTGAAASLGVLALLGTANAATGISTGVPALNVALAAVAAFVVWGRVAKVPFAPPADESPSYP